ncbi:MAG: alpha/beta hydrolase [Spirulinaceae cyanobacterium SM2_1_0]|nr:alpha/beta hydrolase [Spirulinaceae cyanobacterium SM2_1_0]
MTQFYTWSRYRCAYDHHAPETTGDLPPLLLIHPIGVGLSRQFWQRFVAAWLARPGLSPLYNPDLLGCGESDLPRAAYYPEDWAAQLCHLATQKLGQPAVWVVQGALLPVAIRAAEQCPAQVKALVLAGPPALSLLSTEAASRQQRLAWNLFDSPLGWGLYRYVRRRQFLRSFSERQLFDEPAAVDEEWLAMLDAGARSPATRHAVFSFLAGFWRQDYREAIAQLAIPTLVLVGESASSISRSSRAETPSERIASYQQHWPQVQVQQLPGRNVLPYESTAEFTTAVAEFVGRLG